MDENQTIEIRLAANQFIDEKKYWTGELSGELSFSSFPGDTNKTGEKPCLDIFSSRIAGQLFERLNQISGGADPNLHIILSAALMALLERHTGVRDIIVGTTIDRQESTGKLSNTVLPLRIRLSENITFKQLIIMVKEKIERAIENQNYPIEHLVYQDLHMKKPAQGFPLFDVGVLLLNLQEKKYIEHLQLNILFSFVKTAECLECEIDYNSSYYQRESIERIFNHFTQFLMTAAFHVDREIAAIEILTEAEKHLLLHEFNRTQRAYPDNKTIHMLFEDHVASGPDRTAFVYKDEHYSYKPVNENANRLARLLISRGIRADQPVGILLDRSPVMVECILAVWKAGGAYIPMDTQYPFQRMQDMVNSSQTKAILSLQKHITRPLQDACADIIITLESCKEKIAEQSPENLNVEIDMKSLAYIIYTSGSTGKPKGAMVEHRGMLNHIYAKIDALQISRHSIMAQNASHTFDVSVWQFFIALTQGGRTVIFPVGHIFDVGMFITRTITQQITILEVVPSYLAAMLDSSNFETARFKSLEYLLVTGEAVPPGLVSRWFERCPGIKMVNAYGPTEASDDITHYIMDKAPDMERIPVGKTIPNLNIYIVNQRMQLCPIGVKGEICVSGISVGRGYINDDERTKQVFMTDPFAQQKDIRLYKTGDIGCRRPDGNIDFLGRKDY
ncbi:MAG TPA: amino acid adenylation domain-containing protein, partial [Candidatus Deferrimicrobium sp.]|nr:amino acid adenylation domain-containing protein [Candidatus Deferrimicrobium sp.]